MVQSFKSMNSVFDNTHFPQAFEDLVYVCEHKLAKHKILSSVRVGVCVCL